MRRAMFLVCLLLGFFVLAGPPAFPAAAQAPDSWPEPSGDPSGPDGIYGPPMPDPEERLRAGDASAGLLARHVPQHGTGEFETLPGDVDSVDPDADQALMVSIEVEHDLAIDIERFAEFVLVTLNDERSWPGEMSVSFGRTDTDPDLRILLATPETVDALCAPLATGGELSCATEGSAVLNALRWTEGSRTFTEARAGLTDYRRYLLNHEVGHLLGHSHVSCPADGEPAPVMVQQSISLEGCQPNGWVVTD